MAVQNRRGFTLMELLVVVAIISLLVSILMPSLARAKELARRASCAMQVRNLNVVTSVYLEEHDQRFPGWDQSYAPFSGLRADNRISAEMLICPSGIAKVEGPRNRSYSANAFICYEGWQHITKVPSPSLTLHYVEEDETSIDNEHFAVVSGRWWNVIAGRHTRGAVMSFCDFHVEYWAWQWPTTGVFTGYDVMEPGNPDLDRINRAQCPPKVP